MGNVRLRQTNKSRGRRPSTHPHAALSELARLLARQAARSHLSDLQSERSTEAINDSITKYREEDLD